MRLYKQNNGRFLSKKWYCDVYVKGRRYRIPLFESRRVSETFAGRLDRLVGQIESGTGPDRESQDWISQVSESMLKRFAGMGLIPAGRVEGSKLLSDHLSDWKASMQAQGLSPKQVHQNYTRSKKVFDQCRFVVWNDISATRVEVWLKDQRDGGLSIRTSNCYLQSCKQFNKWMVTHNRVSSNPLDCLKKLNGDVDIRRTRRAAAWDEIVYLLRSTKDLGRRYGMEGYQRSMLYLVALETGLRASELQSLNVGNFDLDEGLVHVEAAYSKRRRLDTLPLRSETVAELKQYFKGKKKDEPAFPLIKYFRGADMLKMDLQESRERWIAESANPAERKHRGKSDFLKFETDDGTLDFHSLRHSYITSLVRSGATVKECQTLARHSDPKLTLNVYCHLGINDVRKVVENRPSYSKTPRKSEPKRG